MLSTLFAVLTAAPVLGALAFIVVGEIQNPAIARVRPWLPPATAVVALGASLAILSIAMGAGGEAVVGGWMPVSVLGSPLLISAMPEGAGLIVALACVGLGRTLLDGGETRATRLLQPLAFGGLALASLGNNTLALFVGLGLSDLFGTTMAALKAGDRATRGDVFRAALFHAGSLLALAAGLVQNLAAEGSVYFPLFIAVERSLPFFTAAAVLRFLPAAVLPHGVANSASYVAGAIMLLRLAQLGLIGPAGSLAVPITLGALLALARSLTSSEPEARQRGAFAGALLLSLVPAVDSAASVYAAGGAAWVFGCALLEGQARAARAAGALVLFGVPFTIGFVSRAATTGALASGSELLGLAVWLLGTLALALGLARAVRGDATERGWFDRNWRGWAASATALAPALAFGVMPQWIGAPPLGDALAGHGLAGWAGMAAAVGLIVAVALIARRSAGRWARARSIAERAFSLRWMEVLLVGALDRLGGPFRGAFGFLESNGAMLWAVIAVLIAVLISRSGGP